MLVLSTCFRFLNKDLDFYSELICERIQSEMAKPDHYKTNLNRRHKHQ